MRTCEANGPGWYGVRKRLCYHELDNAESPHADSAMYAQLKGACLNAVEQPLAAARA